MKVDVWFEDVTGAHKAVKFYDVNHNNPEFILPHEGESLGLWQDEVTEGTRNYPLYKVVMVRHYIVKVAMDVWQQEIHVMCEPR